MDRLHIQRRCAIVSVVGLVSILIAYYVVVGEFEISFFRDGTHLALLAWLFAGSNIARWIVGILSGLAAIVGIVLFVGLITQAVGFNDTRGLSLIFMAMGIFCYAFVGWRLLFLPRLRQGEVPIDPAEGRSSLLSP